MEDNLGSMLALAAGSSCSFAVNPTYCYSLSRDSGWFWGVKRSARSHHDHEEGGGRGAADCRVIDMRSSGPPSGPRAHAMGQRHNAAPNDAIREHEARRREEQ